MAQNGVLPPKQERFLSAVLAHPTTTAAAVAAGVGLRTATRWLQNPAFQARLREAQAEALGAVVRALTAAASDAVQTLHDTLCDCTTPAAVKVSAARAVLELLLRLRESLDVEERLSELERLMEVHRGH